MNNGRRSISADIRRVLWCAAAVLTLLGTSAAQDSRTVTEPTFPVSCTVLTAQLMIVSGEPSSETAFDTTRIQDALNACASGEAVELAAGGSDNAFLIQPISIPSGVTLLVDGGVTVFASRNPADYQVSGSSQTCGTIGTDGGGCNPLIVVNKGNTSSGSGLMGYGVIDGRGNDTTLVSGVSSGQNWWDITDSESTGRDQNKPVLLNAFGANNFTIYKITFLNAPYFNVQWSGNGFTVWDAKVTAPGYAPNTDGIDPSGTNMTITKSFLSDGDDNVAVKADSACADITVSNDDTYSGHGISIGSQTNAGLNDMLVENINQYGDGPLAGGDGLRIKSDSQVGGLVQHVTYNNVCSDNVNYPVVIDPNYDSRVGTVIPTFSDITYENVHVIGTKGKFQFTGYDASNLTTMTLNNFVVDSLPQNYITPAMEYVTTTLGPGPVSPALLQTQTGTGVSYTGSVTDPTEAPYACSASSFQFLDGELYLSTTSATNLATLSTVAPGTFTLNAVLQTPQSQVTYTNYESNTYTGVPAPTAAVEFLEGSNVVGTGTLGSNGTLASATLTGVTSGTHTYTAEYPGDANYAAYSFGSVTVTVSPAATVPTTTTLGLSTNTIYDGGSVTLSATVASGSGTPTGSVTFYNGTTSLGSAPLSSGSATLPITPMAVGTESITATYAATGTYLGSSSSAMTLNVVQPFSIAASPASLSLAAGASGSSAITLTPLGGFTGTATYGCSSTASYVTCSVAPGTATTATATITVAATVSELKLRSSHKQLAWYAMLLPFGVFGLLGLRRRQRFGQLLSMLVLLVFAAGLSGCGGGGSAGSGSSSSLPPAGAQTATITASTTTPAGTLIETTQVTVNVTN